MHPKKDRRRQKRYKIKDPAHVLIECGSIGELGDLLDISIGGLAYKRYENSGLINEEAVLELFLSDDSFSIKNIPYNMISDIIIDNDLPFNFIDIVKRRGVKFGLLTGKQISALECFIENHQRGRFILSKEHVSLSIRYLFTKRKRPTGSCTLSR